MEVRRFGAELWAQALDLICDSSERSTSTSEDPVTSLSASEVFQHITKTDEGFGITLKPFILLFTCVLVKRLHD